MTRHRGARSAPPRAPASEEGPLDVAALREVWQRLHRLPAPPALSPDFLRRDLAYRQQADQAGGLSPTTERRLLALADDNGRQPKQSRPQAPRLKPGSTLIREWHGRTYTILALDAGFEMAGQRFASLTEIAHHITGTHWSGPRFFGLRRREASHA